MDKLNSPHLTLAAPFQTGESAPKEIRIDPAASAALAEAIRSAREEAKPEGSPNPLTEAKAKTAPRHRLKSPLLAQAAVALLFLGAGWLASYAGNSGTREAIRLMQAEAARNQDILVKLNDELATLKVAVKARDVEHTASTNPGQARLAEKIDRLAASIQEPGKKLTALEDRLTRMEGQIMAGLNNLSAIKPPAPEQVSEKDSPPAPKPAKAEPVDGWVLREVYNGSALVESRNRGLYEVMPGSLIPGVGKVETIERRGARWVVVTDKGFIGTYR